MPKLFHTCGPNEAMVVSGVGLSKPLLIPGGRVLVWPIIQKIQRLSLNTITLVIESPQVYTQMGVAISVTGIAQVRIEGSNEIALRSACQMFLGKKGSEIKHIALETLEGHQRAIMGTMSIEEIYKDRKKFSSAVFSVASTDLYNMGITVVSYTLKDIRDEEGYLKALGMARTAQVKRDARMGEALAKKEAGIRESNAEKDRMEARFSNDIEIAKCQRDFELKNAAYDFDVNTKKAESDMAYSLQAAKTKQKIKKEQMQIKVIERTQEIHVQEQEIIRKDLELESKVKKPAEAQKFSIETLATAAKKRIILEAEAEADAIKLEGEAEAFAIEAKARAEAEQMEKKAAAWGEYKEAAMIEMVLKMLPKVAAEIATPLAQTNKITMVSNGDSGVGAMKITDEVIAIMNKMPTIMEAMTGIDVTKVLKQAR